MAQNNGNWVSVSRTSALGFEVPGIYAGRYRVRVRAINASDISSVWATSMETYLKGRRQAAGAGRLQGFSVTVGIQLDWGFLTGLKTR